ncbi:MAG: hypothetical protein ACLQU1_39340 [Bryobacteraceae bacterium]
MSAPSKNTSAGYSWSKVIEQGNYAGTGAGTGDRCGQRPGCQQDGAGRGNTRVLVV